MAGPALVVPGCGSTIQRPGGCVATKAASRRTSSSGVRAEEVRRQECEGAIEEVGVGVVEAGDDAAPAGVDPGDVRRRLDRRLRGAHGGDPSVDDQQAGRLRPGRIVRPDTGVLDQDRGLLRALTVVKAMATRAASGKPPALTRPS